MPNLQRFAIGDKSYSDIDLYNLMLRNYQPTLFEEVYLADQLQKHGVENLLKGGILVKTVHGFYLSSLAYHRANEFFSKTKNLDPYIGPLFITPQAKLDIFFDKSAIRKKIVKPLAKYRPAIRKRKKVKHSGQELAIEDFF